MALLNELESRCGSKCELCSSKGTLAAYTVPPKSGNLIEEQVAVCKTCLDQINNHEDLDTNHWRCLNESIWSQVPAVQAISYKLLKRLTSEEWAQDAINMMYMDEATREWAELGGEAGLVHKDSNGQVLETGDTVILIKDLDVKGANFIAKRGVVVRKIRLVTDNVDQIEGKISGQQIVILTEFVKKQS